MEKKKIIYYVSDTERVTAEIKAVHFESHGGKPSGFVTMANGDRIDIDGVCGGDLTSDRVIGRGGDCDYALLPVMDVIRTAAESGIMVDTDCVPESFILFRWVLRGTQAVREYTDEFTIDIACDKAGDKVTGMTGFTGEIYRSEDELELSTDIIVTDESGKKTKCQGVANALAERYDASAAEKVAQAYRDAAALAERLGQRTAIDTDSGEIVVFGKRVALVEDRLVTANRINPDYPDEMLDETTAGAGRYGECYQVDSASRLCDRFRLKSGVRLTRFDSSLDFSYTPLK